VAVVGAGPAGLAAATTLAERGHEVHLYDAASRIGGQFNMAKTIPARKSSRRRCATYQARPHQVTGVQLHLGSASTPSSCRRWASTRCCWPPA
jgi:2,4-dienoyl-CoA reductase (NADPH2)